MTPFSPEWCQNGCDSPSPNGHDGHIPDRLGRGLRGQPACGVWTGEFLSWHINCLELRAVVLGLIHFLPSLRGCHVIVMTDIVSHINRQGGSRSRTLNRHARRLLLWAQDKFLSLRAVHVPGVLNLAADFVKTESQVGGVDVEPSNSSPYLFHKVEVDLFASQELFQCPLWFSLISPAPLGIDAFAHPWPDMRLYMFPPVKLIPAVLCQVKESGVRFLLVALFWPAQICIVAGWSSPHTFIRF